MEEFGKILVGIAALLAVIGLILWKLPGRIPLGRLPGDFYVQKSNFTFYFPLTTCILLSVVLTLVFWLLRR